MSKLLNMLQQRMKGKEQPKMAAMAERSMNGQLATFSGVFSVVDLPEDEQEMIRKILERFSPEGHNLADDFSTLKAITCEVRAINNQAALLHGERIKRAQDLLRRYNDGAFSAWLQAAYGNRQTPYNFLQYFEFYSVLPKDKQNLVEDLPRQAIYSLATRKASLEEKVDFIQNSRGQTKQKILEEMRERFPLSSADKRKSDQTVLARDHLSRALFILGSLKLKRAQARPLKKLTRQIMKSLMENAVDDKRNDDSIPGRHAEANLLSEDHALNHT